MRTCRLYATKGLTSFTLDMLHYLLLSFGVSLFNTKLIGIGIPFVTGVTLVMKRNELHKIDTKTTFGFLYNGYRAKAYFWEIVVMLRKIVIIFIQVFLA